MGAAGQERALLVAEARVELLALSLSLSLSLAFRWADAELTTQRCASTSQFAPKRNSCQHLGSKPETVVTIGRSRLHPFVSTSAAHLIVFVVFYDDCRCCVSFLEYIQLVCLEFLPLPCLSTLCWSFLICVCSVRSSRLRRRILHAREHRSKLDRSLNRARS